MSKLPYPFPELAERMYITSSYDEFDNFTKYYALKEERSLSFRIPISIMLIQNYIREH